MTTLSPSAYLSATLAAIARDHRRATYEHAVKTLRGHALTGKRAPGLVQTLVECCAESEACWQGDVLAVSFDANRLASGEADEVLAAAEQLLERNGHGWVRLEAVEAEDYALV